MATSNKGFLIAFEGGEGSGKTTQIRALHHWLRRHKLEVMITRQPGGTKLGTGIRRLLLNPSGKVSPRAELLLYEADRAQHMDETLLPALERGTVVISDRFTDSSTVYQGICRGLGIGWTARLNDFATNGRTPDLVILLDVPETVGSSRVDRRRQRDRMEKEALAFHRKVRHGFLSLARKSPRRFAVLDGTRDIESLQLEIREIVKRRLARRGFPV